MPDASYLLMVLIADARWVAAEWPPVGRVFTREEAEGFAAQSEDAPRFLLAYGSHVEDLARGEELVMRPGETLWDYGEPLRRDLRAVLRAAAASPSPDVLPAPSAGKVPVRIATVRRLAAEWFGPADPHALETAFDELIFDLGGQRHDAETSSYLVPFAALAPG